MSPDESQAVPVAVAFCPHPPLMLPALEGLPSQETDRLRVTCGGAIQTLLGMAPDVVVVVGDGPPGVRYGAGDGGDLRWWGGAGRQAFAGRISPSGRPLPLAHTVGAWLLDRAGHHGLRLGVAPGDLAETLAEVPGPVGILAMGDGSARRSPKAPGALDPAAADVDAAVSAALAAGDAGALARLSPEDGDRLLAAGTATWRAVGAALVGRSVTAELRHDAAPYGVGYLVADWVVAQVPTAVPAWLLR